MALSSELASLDFESLVGGPLVAVVNAQAQASVAAAQFILNTAFEDPSDPTDPAQLRMVDMKVKKRDVDGNETFVNIEVPLLTMLQVPNIRVSKYKYDFLAKINSVDTVSTDKQFNIGGSLEAKARWGWGSAKLKVATSYKKQTKTGNTVTRDYQMNIQVEAESDQMPGGTEKLLAILESNIAG